MRKTFLLINALEGGGAERVFVSLANHIHARGEQVCLIVGEPGGWKYKNDLDADIPLLTLESQAARKSFWKLFKLLKREKVKTIIVFSYQWALILILMKVGFRLKLKIIVRNISSLSNKRKQDKTLWGGFVFFLVDCLYKRADFFVAQCNGMKDELVRDFGVPCSNISVIYNPVNPTFESKEPITIDRIPDDFQERYFLFVGSLKIAKNINDCLRAFSIFAKQNPNIHLKICGEGSLKPLIMLEIKRLNLTGRVRFTGFRDDLRPFYKNAIATLLTSVYEGFPNVLIESITMGTPVISYDCQHGPREIIIDGENGYLIEYGDYRSFADMMRKILHSPLDPEMVKRSSRRFSIDHIGAQYIRLINDQSENEPHPKHG